MPSLNRPDGWTPTLPHPLTALGWAGAVAVLTIAAFHYAAWVRAYNKEMEASAQAYELCIFSQYHMTPAEYVGEYGEQPVCTN